MQYGRIGEYYTSRMNYIFHSLGAKLFHCFYLSKLLTDIAIYILWPMWFKK